MSNIKVVELFAGVGGFRLGLETASPLFETVFASQWEPGLKKQHAATIYKNHWSPDKLGYKFSNQDIAEVISEVPSHDLLVGGFPCQDYSVASTGAKGIEGKKGVLWWSIEKILNQQRPSYVLLENVDRLLKSSSKQRGRDFGIILYSFAQLGYSVAWKVVNAAEYGFTQRRRRVFIYATTKPGLPVDKFFGNIFPSTVEPGTTKTTNFNAYSSLLEVSDQFAFPFENEGFMVNGVIETMKTFPKTVPGVPLKDLLDTVSDVTSSYYIKDDTKWQYLKGAKRIPRVKPNGDKYFYSEGAMAFPENVNLPARTVLTSEGSVNRSSHAVVDPGTGKIRTLTPVEVERVNGFPDDWTLVDGVPARFRYFAMGNALVVPVVTEIGREILRFAGKTQQQ